MSGDTRRHRGGGRRLFRGLCDESFCSLSFVNFCPILNVRGFGLTSLAVTTYVVEVLICPSRARGERRRVPRAHYEFPRDNDGYVSNDGGTCTEPEDFPPK